MSVLRLLAIAAIIGCTAVAWFILGGALRVRSLTAASKLSPEVAANWGPELKQEPPSIFYISPTNAGGKKDISPEESRVAVQLTYEKKQKGLLWHRTYLVDFDASYRVRNPMPIAQTIYVAFQFPSTEARYDRFTLQFGDKKTERAPSDGRIQESLVLQPGAETTLKVAYRAAGTNLWAYMLGGSKRVRNLHLAMTTDFPEINVPAGAESPTSRERSGKGFVLNWDYTDVIGANSIAMDMPAVTNPGEVANRMTFFAPVSLLFFFAVLVMMTIGLSKNLHPMNFFFLAAGCFAFQLLFAYLVDLLPLLPSFVIAATVSLLLVNGYLWRVAGPKFAQLSALAQFAYMVLFSYSFFFEGLTGITITVGAIITLALLMAFTARIDWQTALSGRQPVADGIQ